MEPELINTINDLEERVLKESKDIENQNSVFISVKNTASFSYIA